MVKCIKVTQTPYIKRRKKRSRPSTKQVYINIKKGLAQDNKVKSVEFLHMEDSTKNTNNFWTNKKIDLLNCTIPLYFNFS